MREKIAVFAPSPRGTPLMSIFVTCAACGKRHSAPDRAAAPSGFQRQAPAAGDTSGRNLGQHFGHVRLDHLVPGGSGDRDAVVTVFDEMQVAEAVDVDRRDRRAAPLREIEPLPPLPHPV